MPTLHHLSTAQNLYPAGVKPLSGCLNDARATKAYLRALAKEMDQPYHSTELLDMQVTRKNLIQAFRQISQAAQPGDSIIWTHSGHGTRLKAPPEFHHQNADRRHRALVIWNEDGRTADFLLDKEMSWLIWSVTNKKDVTFLCLMDCCYAGANLRNKDAQERRSAVGESQQPRAVEDYLGFEDYTTEDGGHTYTVPRGTYLQIAAARPDQAAMELSFTGIGHQGVFTYALLTELRTCGRAHSYQKIFEDVKTRVARMTRYQEPQLDYSAGFNARCRFLGDAIADNHSAYRLYYKGSTYQYMVNAGSIAGLTGRGEEATVKVNGKNVPLVFETIGPGKSVIKETVDFGREPLHVTLNKQMKHVLPVAFAPDFPEPDKEKFERAYVQTTTEYIRLVDDPQAVDYWIAYDLARAPCVYAKKTKQYFFQHGGTNNLHRFWETVDRIGRWHYVDQLHNPTTKLSAADLEINLRHYDTAPDYEWDSPHQTVDDWANGLQLTGKFNPHRYLIPAFAGTITNTSGQSLEVRALVLGNDYSITAECTSHSLVLEPGQSVKLEDKFKFPVLDEQGNKIKGPNNKSVKERRPTNQIRYGTSPALRERGITWNPETLLFLVSTESLDVTHLTQEGVPEKTDLRGQPKDDPAEPQTKGQDEDDDDDEVIETSDWTVFRVPTTMMRLAWSEPKKPTARLVQHKLTSRSINFSHHFIALAAAATFFPEGLGNLKHKGENVMLYEWSYGFNHAPGNEVLVLANLNGIERISAENPLRIEFPISKENHTAQLAPFAWQGGEALIDLPFSRQGRSIMLHGLPAPINLPGFAAMTGKANTSDSCILLLLCYISNPLS